VRTVDGNLTIDSRDGDITMGRGERLSVPGTLRLDADRGRATISDLTGLDVEISANDLTVMLRGPSPVELPDMTIIEDDGVDIIGNTVRIRVGNDEVLLDGDGVVTFAVEHQPGTGFDELTVPEVFTPNGAGVVQISSIKRDSLPIENRDILRNSDMVVLDGVAVGATPSLLFLSGLVPVLPEPPEPPDVGPAPPKKEEVMAWMQCAQLSSDEEVPAECLEAGVGVGGFDQDAFQDSSALGVLQLYRALVRSDATATRIRPAFQAAILSYREQANSDQVLGDDFRKYVWSSEEHRDASDYLEQFEFLFAQLRQINMLPNDYSATRDELLVEIVQELQLGEMTTTDELGATFIPGEKPSGEEPSV
jgi:hypothetical protein